MVMEGYETWGDHFIRYIAVRSLCFIPEINIMLYVNYTWIKSQNSELMLAYKVTQWSGLGLLPQSARLAYTACYQERCTGHHCQQHH